MTTALEVVLRIARNVGWDGDADTLMEGVLDLADTLAGEDTGDADTLVEALEILEPYVKPEVVVSALTVTENDTYTAESGHAYSPVTVNVSGVTVDPLPVTQNGTYTAASGHAYSPVTVNVSGSGGSGNMSDPIRFFDYDGTLVASYTAVPSALPSVPTHTGLTNGTWNYTLPQVTTQFNAMGTCDVGANYDTVSGATEIDCEFVDGRLSPYLRLATKGTVTIDWGDGSATETVTGTSLTSRKSAQHTYASAGSYTIKLTPASGTTYAMYGGSSTYRLLYRSTSSENQNVVYADCVKHVRVGAGCAVGNYAFGFCYSLQTVSLPSSVEKFDSYAFTTCYSLRFLSLPSGMTSTDDNVFRSCYSLRLISLPSTITTIGTSAFYGCQTLQSISIPSEVTTVSSSSFSNCSSLQSVVFSNNITSLGSGSFSACSSLVRVTVGNALASIARTAFSGCYGVAEYHFASTTPPTLTNTDAFTSIPDDCVIYVPRSENQTVLNTYKTAENWATYASYMQEEPQ